MQQQSDAVIDTLKRFGAVAQSKTTPRGVEYRIVFPARLTNTGKPVIVTHTESLPYEVGAFGDRLKSVAKKVTTVAKKVASNKVVATIAKVAPALSRVLPGPVGQAVAKAGAQLKGIQRGAKVASGNLSGELALLKQAASVIPGAGGAMAKAGGGLAAIARARAAAKPIKKSITTAINKQVAAAVKNPPPGASFTVKGKSGRMYRVTPL